MNILVTGAKGMVGTALVANLKNIKEGKNRTRPGLNIDGIYEYDIHSTAEQLEEYCQTADFVFNFGGRKPSRKSGGLYEGQLRLCQCASGYP